MEVILAMYDYGDEGLEKHSMGRTRVRFRIIHPTYQKDFSHRARSIEERLRQWNSPFLGRYE